MFILESICFVLKRIKKNLFGKSSASVAEFPATPNNSTVQSSNDSPKNEDDAFNLSKYK